MSSRKKTADPSLGKLLSRIRKGKKMTLESVTEQAKKFSPGHLSRMENGFAPITTDELRALIEVLDPTDAELKQIAELVFGRTTSQSGTEEDSSTTDFRLLLRRIAILNSPVSEEEITYLLEEQRRHSSTMTRELIEALLHQRRL